MATPPVMSEKQAYSAPPPMVAAPQGGLPEREFNNGLFGCCSNGETGSCLLACFCPCFVHGSNVSRREHLQFKNAPHPSGGESCNGPCCFDCVLIYFGFGCVLPCVARGDLRKALNIRGSAGGDCCAQFCCQPCALSQEAAELSGWESSYRA